MKFIAVSVCGAVTVGLSVANEVRRQAILTQNETIVQKAQKDLEDLRRLGFLERDIPVHCEFCTKPDKTAPVAHR